MTVGVGERVHYHIRVLATVENMVRFIVILFGIYAEYTAIRLGPNYVFRRHGAQSRSIGFTFLALSRDNLHQIDGDVNSCRVNCSQTMRIRHPELDSGSRARC